MYSISVCTVVLHTFKERNIFTRVVIQNVLRGILWSKNETISSNRERGNIFIATSPHPPILLYRDFMRVDGDTLLTIFRIQYLKTFVLNMRPHIFVLNSQDKL